MSLKNVEKFFELVKSNKNIAEELIKIKDKLQQKGKVLDEIQFVKDEIIPLAQKNGIDFAPEEFLNYVKAQISELSDEDLLNVSGGGNFQNFLLAGMLTFLSSLPVAVGVNSFKLVEPIAQEATQNSEINTQTSQGGKVDEDASAKAKSDSQMDGASKKSPGSKTRSSKNANKNKTAGKARGNSLNRAQPSSHRRAPQNGSAVSAGLQGDVENLSQPQLSTPADVSAGSSVPTGSEVSQNNSVKSFTSQPQNEPMPQSEEVVVKPAPAPIHAPVPDPQPNIKPEPAPTPVPDPQPNIKSEPAPDPAPVPLVEPKYNDVHRGWTAERARALANYLRSNFDLGTFSEAVLDSETENSLKDFLYNCEVTKKGTFIHGVRIDNEDAATLFSYCAEKYDYIFGTNKNIKDEIVKTFIINKDPESFIDFAESINRDGLNDLKILVNTWREMKRSGEYTEYPQLRKDVYKSASQFISKARELIKAKNSVSKEIKDVVHEDETPVATSSFRWQRITYWAKALVIDAVVAYLTYKYGDVIYGFVNDIKDYVVSLFHKGTPFSNMVNDTVDHFENQCLSNGIIPTDITTNTTPLVNRSNFVKNISNIAKKSTALVDKNNVTNFISTNYNPAIQENINKLGEQLISQPGSSTSVALVSQSMQNVDAPDVAQKVGGLVEYGKSIGSTVANYFTNWGAPGTNVANSVNKFATGSGLVDPNNPPSDWVGTVTEKGLSVVPQSMKKLDAPSLSSLTQYGVSTIKDAGSAISSLGGQALYKGGEVFASIKNSLSSIVGDAPTFAKAVTDSNGMLPANLETLGKNAQFATNTLTKQGGSGAINLATTAGKEALNSLVESSKNFIDTNGSINVAKEVTEVDNPLAFNYGPLNMLKGAGNAISSLGGQTLDKVKNVAESVYGMLPGNPGNSIEIHENTFTPHTKEDLKLLRQTLGNVAKQNITNTNSTLSMPGASLFSGIKNFLIDNKISVVTIAGICVLLGGASYWAYKCFKGTPTQALNASSDDQSSGAGQGTDRNPGGQVPGTNAASIPSQPNDTNNDTDGNRKEKPDKNKFGDKGTEEEGSNEYNPHSGSDSNSDGDDDDDDNSGKPPAKAGITAKKVTVKNDDDDSNSHKKSNTESKDDAKEQEDKSKNDLKLKGLKEKTKKEQNTADKKKEKKERKKERKNEAKAAKENILKNPDLTRGSKPQDDDKSEKNHEPKKMAKEEIIIAPVLPVGEGKPEKEHEVISTPSIESKENSEETKVAPSKNEDKRPKIETEEEKEAVNFDMTAKEGLKDEKINDLDAPAEEGIEKDKADKDLGTPDKKGNTGKDLGAPDKKGNAGKTVITTDEEKVDDTNKDLDKKAPADVSGTLHEGMSSEKINAEENKAGSDDEAAKPENDSLHSEETGKEKNDAEKANEFNDDKDYLFEKLSESAEANKLLFDYNDDDFEPVENSWNEEEDIAEAESAKNKGKASVAAQDENSEPKVESSNKDEAQSAAAGAALTPDGTNVDASSKKGATAGTNLAASSKENKDAAKEDSSQNIVASGYCGLKNTDDIKWTFYKNGQLEIIGNGAMANYQIKFGEVNAPWNKYANKIKSINISGNVTSIGNFAFYDCSVTSVTISSKVLSIGDSAFYNCNNITSFVIPDSVTSIGKESFLFCKGLTNIAIPENVTTIGEAAFRACTALKSININSNITTISPYTFAECTALESIDIPSSVTVIGERAFYFCSSLKSIKIPDKVTVIEEYTFAECSNLIEVTIPNTVTTIKERAFSDCKSLPSLIIPRSVTVIEQCAFFNCPKLKTINFEGTQNPANGIKLFTPDEDKRQPPITINVPSDYKDDYFGCAKVTKPAVPIGSNNDNDFGPGPDGPDSGLGSDHDPSFEGSENDGLTKPGADSLHSDTKNDVNAASEEKDITETETAENKDEKEVSYTDEYEKLVSENNLYCEQLTDYMIKNFLMNKFGPDKIDEMNSDMFSRFDWFSQRMVVTKKGILLPHRLLFDKSSPPPITPIDNNVAITLCKYLAHAQPSYFITDVNKNEYGLSENEYGKPIENEAMRCIFSNISPQDIFENAKYAGIDGLENLKALLKTYKEMQESGILLQYPKFIQNSAKNFAPKLEQFIKEKESELNTNNDDSDSGSSTGRSDFDSGSDFGPGSNGGGNNKAQQENNKKSGNEAAEGSSEEQNKSVNTENQKGKETTPTNDNAEKSEKDENIENEGFCGDLSINNGEDVKWTLYKNGELEIKGNGDMRAEYQETSDIPWYSYKDSITSIKIIEGVTAIAGGAFVKCSEATSINIPNGIAKIGIQALGYCSKLTQIKLPESVTSIGERAFIGCSSLGQVKLPQELTLIDGSAFANCTNLKSINIPNKVTSIGDNAFGNCTSLESIDIPSSVKSIGFGSFLHCTGLANVKLAEGLISIGSFAFSYCESLTEITIPSSVTSIGEFALSYCPNLGVVIYDGENNPAKATGWKDTTHEEDSTDMLVNLFTPPTLGETYVVPRPYVKSNYYKSKYFGNISLELDRYSPQFKTQPTPRKGYKTPIKGSETSYNIENSEGVPITPLIGVLKSGSQNDEDNDIAKKITFSSNSGSDEENVSKNEKTTPSSDFDQREEKTSTNESAPSSDFDQNEKKTSTNESATTNETDNKNTFSSDSEQKENEKFNDINNNNPTTAEKDATISDEELSSFGSSESEREEIDTLPEDPGANDKKNITKNAKEVGNKITSKNSLADLSNLSSDNGFSASDSNIAYSEDESSQVIDKSITPNIAKSLLEDNDSLDDDDFGSSDSSEDESGQLNDNKNDAKSKTPKIANNIINNDQSDNKIDSASNNSDTDVNKAENTKNEVGEAVPPQGKDFSGNKTNESTTHKKSDEQTDNKMGIPSNDSASFASSDSEDKAENTKNEAPESGKTKMLDSVQAEEKHNKNLVPKLPFNLKALYDSVPSPRKENEDKDNKKLVDYVESDDENPLLNMSTPKKAPNSPKPNQTPAQAPTGNEKQQAKSSAATKGEQTSKNKGPKAKKDNVEKFGDNEENEESRKVIGWTRERILKLLTPLNNTVATNNSDNPYSLPDETKNELTEFFDNLNIFYILKDSSSFNRKVFKIGETIIKDQTYVNTIEKLIPHYSKATFIGLNNERTDINNVEFKKKLERETRRCSILTAGPHQTLKAYLEKFRNRQEAKNMMVLYAQTLQTLVEGKAAGKQLKEYAPYIQDAVKTTYTNMKTDFSYGTNQFEQKLDEIINQIVQAS